MSLTRIPMTREGVAKSRASRRSGCLRDIQVVFFLPASQGLACLLASRFAVLEGALLLQGQQRQVQLLSSKPRKHAVAMLEPEQLLTMAVHEGQFLKMKQSYTHQSVRLVIRRSQLF